MLYRLDLMAKSEYQFNCNILIINDHLCAGIIRLHNGLVVYILDTNTILEIIKPRPNIKVIECLESNPNYLTSCSLH
jgi:hypothetical protein